MCSALFMFLRRAGLIIAVLSLAACAKEPLDGPAGQVAGSAKSMTTQATVDDPDNGDGGDEAGKDGDTGTISDDGDDVGDGERSKKKKPN